MVAVGARFSECRLCNVAAGAWSGLLPRKSKYREAVLATDSITASRSLCTPVSTLCSSFLDLKLGVREEQERRQRPRENSGHVIGPLVQHARRRKWPVQSC